jgi:hypothetical protein
VEKRRIVREYETKAIVTEYEIIFKPFSDENVRESYNRLKESHEIFQRSKTKE